MGEIAGSGPDAELDRGGGDGRASCCGARSVSSASSCCVCSSLSSALCSCPPLPGSSSDSSSSSADSDSESDMFCPSCAALSSARSEDLSGRVSVFEPRRERVVGSCAVPDGRRDIVGVAWASGVRPSGRLSCIDGRREVEGDMARLYGLPSCMEGRREAAGEKAAAEAGVGGPSCPWSSMCSRVASSCLDKCEMWAGGDGMGGLTCTSCSGFYGVGRSVLVEQSRMVSGETLRKSLFLLLRRHLGTVFVRGLSTLKDCRLTHDVLDNPLEIEHPCCLISFRDLIRGLVEDLQLSQKSWIRSMKMVT